MYQQNFQRGNMMNQPMGQMQQQPQFQPPDEMKTINVGQSESKTVDLDPQTGLISVGQFNCGMLYQFQTGQMCQKLPEISGETYIRLVAPNTYVIVCTHLRDMIIIMNPNLQGGKPTIKTIKHGCDFNISYSFIEKLANGTVAVSLNKTICVIDPVKCVVLNKLTKDGRIRCLFPLPDGKLLAGYSRQYTGQNQGGYLETDAELFIWDISQGTAQMFRPSMEQRNRSTCEGIRAVTFSPGRNKVVSAVGDYNTEAKIWVWQLPNNQVCGQMDFQWPLKVTKKEKEISISALSVIGKYVIAGVQQGNIKIFDIDTCQMLHTLQNVHEKGGYIKDIRVKLDQNMFITAGYKAIKVWQIPNSWKMTIMQPQQTQQQPVMNQQQQQQPNQGGGQCMNCQKHLKEIERLKTEVEKYKNMAMKLMKPKQPNMNQPNMGIQQQPMMMNQNQNNTMQQRQPMMMNNMMGRGMVGNNNMMMGRGNQQQMMMNNQNQQMMGRGNMMMGRGNMMGQQNQNQWGK